MAVNDLMSVKQWLIDKELLVSDPTPDQYEKSVDWVRRHLFVPLYTHKRGYAQVSRSAIDNAYKKFLNDSVKVRVNKERAAVKLNAKNMAVKVYKGVFNFDTKAQREAFFQSKEGKEAFRFFFECLVYAKPHVLLPNEAWVYIKPSEKLKELLLKYKDKIKLEDYVWSLILETPHTENAPMATLKQVLLSADNKGISAAEVKNNNKKKGLPAGRRTKMSGLEILRETLKTELQAAVDQDVDQDQIDNIQEHLEKVEADIVKEEARLDVLKKREEKKLQKESKTPKEENP